MPLSLSSFGMDRGKELSDTALGNYYSHHPLPRQVYESEQLVNLVTELSLPHRNSLLMYLKALS